MDMITGHMQGLLQSLLRSKLEWEMCNIDEVNIKWDELKSPIKLN